jgi:hypothetical protein
MRKLFFLCGTILCLSMTVAAQDATATFDASNSASEPAAAPVSLGVVDRTPWQLEIGYQYQHLRPLGLAMHTNGFHTDVTRYLNDWIGVEGVAIMGFGSTSTSPISTPTKSLFVGGGLHSALYVGTRFEPWIHGLVGLEHIRTAVSNSGLGFMGGGGLDYKLNPRLFWRIQGDFVGTRFNTFMHDGYAVATGVVLNF